MPEERSAGQLLVLGKISAILDSFTLERPVLSLGDLREATGLPASTLQRLVANLVDEGFLDRDAQGLRIGVRVAYWAAAAARGVDVLEVVRPVLSDLRDELGETACFYQASAGVRVCTAVAETRHGVRRPMRVGQAMPVHAGSAGHVLLAHDPELAERVLSGGLAPLTERTITDPEALRRALVQAREDGFAITVGERESGASGLSAPVFDAHAEVVGAVTVMGPTFRMPSGRLSEWVEPVVGAAHRITRMLGGRAPTSS
ncbi:IclR family transcriptional regulator [Mariniluteicoccus endophyticus]